MSAPVMKLSKAKNGTLALYKLRQFNALFKITAQSCFLVFLCYLFCCHMKQKPRVNCVLIKEPHKLTI